MTFIVQSYSDTLALCSDILWSSCFESYGPKDTPKSAGEVIRCV